MTRIQIPSTRKEMIAVLGDIDALVTSKEWARAAHVYAYTYDTKNQYGAGASSHRLSCTEFAKLGIAGLSTHQTVSSYRSNWKLAMAQGLADDIGPGDRVELPDMEWPGRTDKDGLKRYVEKAPANMARALRNMSDVEVEAFAQDLGDDVAMAMLRNIADVHPDLVAEVAEETPGIDSGITPARVVEEIRNNPDVVRAVSRHDDVIDLIEDQVSVRRGSAIDAVAEQYADSQRRMARNVRKALDLQEDEATHCLRMAATFIMNAVVACEEHGIEYPEAEQEAIKRIKRNLKIYEAQGPLNDADRKWAAENGIEVPQE